MTRTTRATAGVALSRTLLVDVAAPLVVFYGLRWAGTNQILALAAGAVFPLASGLLDLTRHRRIGGVRLFVLGLMVLTVAVSFITGSPRALLIRSAVMMAALGIFLLISLRAAHPFLYRAAELVIPADRQPAWRDNWDRYPAFRQVLRLLSAFWALGCLADAVLRLILALTLPVDTVPALDAALLVITLVILIAVQRSYGRVYLRRHGLRLQGTSIEPAEA